MVSRLDRPQDGLCLTGRHWAPRLGADEMGYVSRAHLGLPAGKPMAVIFESGINKAILRRNRPEAVAFQEWATRDVLPAIRKDGAYVQGEERRQERARTAQTQPVGT
jgi:prophage antirepressor-like protein